MSRAAQAPQQQQQHHQQMQQQQAAPAQPGASQQQAGGSRKISFNVSDQYEIQDVVGEGAYGVVWLVFLSRGFFVTLVWIRHVYLSIFIADANALTCLRHI
jgi:hypothetical protein